MRHLLVFLLLSGIWNIASCKPLHVSSKSSEGKGLSFGSADSEKIETVAELRKYLLSMNFAIEATEVSDVSKSLITGLKKNQVQSTKIDSQTSAGVARVLDFLEYLSRFSTSVEGQTSNYTLAHTFKNGQPLDNQSYLVAARKVIVIPAWLNDKEFLGLITKDGSKDGPIRLKLEALNKKENRNQQSAIRFIRYAERDVLGSGARNDGRSGADRSLFFIPSRQPRDLDYAIMFSGAETVSVIGIDGSSGQPQSYYYDHILSDGRITATRQPLFGNSCQICHKSGGFLGIHPNENFVLDPESAKNIKVFNQFVENTGVAHHLIYDQVESRLDSKFPAFGSRRLTKARIVEIFKGRSLPTGVNLESFAEKVSKLDACSDCHSVRSSDGRPSSGGALTNGHIFSFQR
ncbi:MAG: hypothetical protein NTV34_17530 [Proteobacteria bacterium]|nr:hypothetical protein [Pseudomonadota bacterium]